MALYEGYTTLAEAEEKQSGNIKKPSELVAAVSDVIPAQTENTSEPAADNTSPETGGVVKTRDLVTLVAYLIGLKREYLEQYFADGNEIIEKINNLKEAKIIRYLSKIRTTLFQKYGKVDHDIRFELKNLNRQDIFDVNNINELDKLGVPILQANYTAEKYIIHVSGLINTNIDACKHLFPDWVKWEYVRDLFYIPKYNQPGVVHAEMDLLRNEFNNYPYHMYIHWKPQQAGLILTSDTKLLSVLYEQHNDTFNDYTKLRDVAEPVKTNIYNFIDAAGSVAIAVDCENSDPFKLYSVIKGLDADEMAKINKLSLYDDANTTFAWDWLGKYLHIPVEHIEVERVVGHKSLVDIKMAVCVSRDYYENQIDSFILFSSDSDFWGLISSMRETKFLVMFEYDKCGTAIREAFTKHGIYHCAIDDFCSAPAGDFKKIVLLKELESRLPNILGLKPIDVAYSVYEACKITGTKQEIENFAEKYIKTLKLQVGEDGALEIAIRK